MTPFLAPLWAFIPEAIDGAGDTHLPPGVHVRALPSATLGLPASPLVVTRAVLNETQRISRSDGVVWFDSHGAPLTLPFDVTADNPVTGYFPVQDVFFAELNAILAPIVILPPPREPLPTPASVPKRLPIPALPKFVRPPVAVAANPVLAANLKALADHLAARLTFQAPLRFEALTNSVLGPAPVQSRSVAPYQLAGVTM